MPAIARGRNQMSSNMSAGNLKEYYYSGVHTGRISSSSQDRGNAADDSLVGARNPVNITNVSDIYAKLPGSSSQQHSMSGTQAETLLNMNHNSSVGNPSQFQLYGSEMQQHMSSAQK